MRRFGIVLFIFMFILSVIPLPADEELKKIAFIPLWVPQAQFAGYYVALEKGFYQNHGLDVTIIAGGPDRPPCDYIRDGKADVALMWLSTGMQQCGKGVTLFNIAQILKRSALMLVAKKKSGIIAPSDLANRKVGLWEGTLQIQPRAFFRKYDLSVTVIPQTYSVNLFLRDGVDVASAMLYNEYHTILNSGLDEDELTTFLFYEHNLNFPEDGLYVLKKNYMQDPEKYCSFVSASLEGWKYAFEHPDEAINIIIKYMRKAHVPANRVHQRWMLKTMKELMVDNQTKTITSNLSEEEYQMVGKLLIDAGSIKKVPEYSAFFRKCDISVDLQDEKK